MSLTGLVVARYRKHVDVRDAEGQRHLCQTLGRRLSPVAGDEVEWTLQDDGTGIVTAIKPRRTELTRTDSRGNREVIVANLTSLVVVTAARPAPDWSVVDRYLAAARLMNLPAVIVYNKTDLEPADPEATRRCLSDYERIGYPVFRTSTITATGVAALAGVMSGERCALVGQSGVGKSSLTNALTGQSLQSVGGLSAKGDHGRHTTTTSVLHELPGGGELVDSPGVRAYTPHISNVPDLHFGFAEFAVLTGQCRFADCRHVEEPDCAIRAAVASGDISRRRYESYLNLLAIVERLADRRPRA
jgi:ribosome biogenesis GTPase / thiamine phosphate phosphatase